MVKKMIDNNLPVFIGWARRSFCHFESVTKQPNRELIDIPINFLMNADCV